MCNECVKGTGRLSLVDARDVEGDLCTIVFSDVVDMARRPLMGDEILDHPAKGHLDQDSQVK